MAHSLLSRTGGYEVPRSVANLPWIWPHAAGESVIADLPSTNAIDRHRKEGCFGAVQLV